MESSHKGRARHLLTIQVRKSIFTIIDIADEGRKGENQHSHSNKERSKMPQLAEKGVLYPNRTSGFLGRDHTGNKAHEGRGIAEDDRIDIDRKHLHEALLDRMGYDG